METQLGQPRHESLPQDESTIDRTLRFRVSHSSGKKRLLRLAGARISFGSGEGCSVRLQGEGVRALHAVLIQAEGQCVLRGFTMPLPVNGQKTTEASLQAGDIFAIGSYEFELLPPENARGENDDRDVMPEHETRRRLAFARAFRPVTSPSKAAQHDVALDRNSLRAPTAPRTDPLFERVDLLTQKLGHVASVLEAEHLASQFTAEVQAAQTNAALEQAKADLEKEKSENAALQQRIAELSTQAEELEKRAAESEEQLATQTAAADRTAAQLAEAEQTIARLHAHREEDRNSWEAEATGLHDQLQSIALELSQSNGRIEDLQREHESSLRTIDQLNEQLERQSEQLMQTTKELEQANETQAVSGRERGELESQLASTISELNKARQQLESANEAVSDLEGKVAAADTALEEVQQASDAKVAELEERLEDAKSSVASLSEDFESLQEQHQTLKESVQAMEANERRHQTELQDKDAELAELAAELQQTQSQLTESEEVSATKTRELEERTNIALQELEEAYRQLAALQSGVAQADDRARQTDHEAGEATLDGEAGGDGTDLDSYFELPDDDKLFRLDRQGDDGEPRQAAESVPEATEPNEVQSAADAWQQDEEALSSHHDENALTELAAESARQEPLSSDTDSEGMAEENLLRSKATDDESDEDERSQAAFEVPPAMELEESETVMADATDSPPQLPESWNEAAGETAAEENAPSHEFSGGYDIPLLQHDDEEAEEVNEMDASEPSMGTNARDDDADAVVGVDETLADPWGDTALEAPSESFDDSQKEMSGEARDALGGPGESETRIVDDGEEPSADEGNVLFDAGPDAESGLRSWDASERFESPDVANAIDDEEEEPPSLSDTAGQIETFAGSAQSEESLQDPAVREENEVPTDEVDRGSQDESVWGNDAWAAEPSAAAGDEMDAPTANSNDAFSRRLRQHLGVSSEELASDVDEETAKVQTAEEELPKTESGLPNWFSEMGEDAESDAASGAMAATDGETHVSDSVEGKGTGPESAAEILARLGQSVDEGETLVSGEAVEQGSLEADASAVAESHLSDAVEEASVLGKNGGGDDESIESYMNRLLARVGKSTDEEGGRVEPVVPGVSKPASEKREPAADDSTHGQDVNFDPMEEEAFVPRSHAPEKGSDLAAMRELANSSARSAIRSSNRKRVWAAAGSKMIISAVALMTSVGLTTFNGFEFGFLIILAGCFLTVSVVWGADSVLTLRKIGREQKPQGES